MDSKYFKVGAVVDIVTPKSRIGDRNVTLLEISSIGIVGTQKAITNAPIKFYSWDKVEELQLTQERVVTGITRTSGSMTNAKTVGA